MRNGYYDPKDLLLTGLPTGKFTVPVNGVKGDLTLDWSSPGPGNRRLWVENGRVRFNTEHEFLEWLGTQHVPAIFAQVFQTSDWPSWAGYKATYRIRAWPCGYETNIKFFQAKEELEEWKLQMTEWSFEEGNGFQLMKLEEWDWGPVQMAC